jgi:hypothetical protein
MKALALLFVTLPVMAHQFTREECVRVANDAYLIAQDRDKGVSQKEQIAEAATLLPKCHQNAECPYKDDKDDVIVIHMIEGIYAQKDMSAETIGQSIYNGCVASSVSLPHGIRPSGPQLGV